MTDPTALLAQACHLLDQALDELNRLRPLSPRVADLRRQRRDLARQAGVPDAILRGQAGKEPS